MYFDYDKAVTDGASPETLQGEDVFNKMQNSNPNARFKFYGNWYGPNHSGPTGPIDSLDRACMNHDKCYARNGYYNCSCDRQFLVDIARMYDTLPGWKKVYADAMTTAFIVINNCKS